MKHYRAPIEKLFEVFDTGLRGLTPEEAQKRLLRFGENRLPEARPENFFWLFLRQFQSPLIYVLLVAAGIVFFTGEIVDGLIILFVLVFNAVVGVVQEGRTQNTLRALKQLVETEATVLRGGEELIVSDRELVPGDIILLAEGQKIPADGRLLATQQLRVDEAVLTGESLAVDKTVELSGARTKGDLPLSEQTNMVFKGTQIVAGSGRVLVLATGLQTVVGKISQEVASLDTEIPLKADIRRLARFIIAGITIVAAILFSAGLFWFGKEAQEMFKLVVALSVSFIPEGLPVALTLILVAGVWRMAKRNALVKRLQAVEALGQARVIAVDKTGTITKNELVIQKVFVGGQIFEVGGVGYNSQGELFFEGKPIVAAESPALLLAGRVAAFAANARVSFDDKEKAWRVAGDPTEAAILVFGQKIGFRREELEASHPLQEEISFDYRLKYRAVARDDGERRKFLALVGAPETVLGVSRSWWLGPGREMKLGPERIKELTEVFHRLSREGFRVLAFAFREKFTGTLAAAKLPEIVFGGFYAMKDALRPEVKRAVMRARNAGMRVVMITGDHRLTAEVIAREAEIFHDGDLLLTGEELNRLNDGELDEKIVQTTVFARVTPEDKLRIIKSFKRRGEIVAMTGDGVNDAPSLVAADLGVAMGRVGTEVAKEAADIVLLDDDFGSIVAAVEEGRSIYRTIRKVLQYLFSTNLGEVLLIGFALFAGYPLPLLAGQIVWLNFITDGFLVTALALEPKEEGLLKKKFKKTRQLVDNTLVLSSLLVALVMALGGMFVFARYVDVDLVKAQTMALTVMAVFQWFRVWSARSEDESIFRINPWSNWLLLVATVAVVLLQLGAVYLPPLQAVLRTTALSLGEWFFVVAVALSVFAVEETRKAFVRLRVQK